MSGHFQSAKVLASAPPLHARENAQLFTIGHSNRETVRFLELLRRYEIALVADVRSSPFSRFNPQFNREPLGAALSAAGISYAFLGRELGARREEAECYVGGIARYGLIARTPLFREGIAWVRDALRQRRVCLMCAEKDPLTCHRSILVARHLRSPDMRIEHILDDGSCESLAEAEERLLRLHFPEGKDLFRTHDELIEEAYDLQADRIQYAETVGAH